MMSNLSTVERRFRFVVGCLIWLLYVTGMISGGLSHALAVMSVIFVATSIMNFCPYYFVFDLAFDRDLEV